MIHTGGVQNSRTVMSFSFVKFPSKPLSFFLPLLSECCLSLLTFPLFLSHPPLHTVLLSSAFSSNHFFLLFFYFSFTLSFPLLLFLLGWEEVTGLFLDPGGIERWSSLSCNPFFIRPQLVATQLCPTSMVNFLFVSLSEMFLPTWGITTIKKYIFYHLSLWQVI